MATVLQSFPNDVEKVIEYEVAFVVKGNRLNPPDISTHLNIIPTNFYSLGDIVQIPKSKKSNKQLKRPWGLWRKSSTEAIDSNNLEDHLEYIVGLFEPKTNKLKLYLDNPDEFEIMIRIWRKGEGLSGQIDINSELFRRISYLCHIITFHYIFAEIQEQ